MSGGNSSLNSSVTNTTSSPTFNFFFLVDNDQLEKLIAFRAILLVLGTPLNFWMLAAILTSPEIRSSLRSKLICVILLNNLLKSVLTQPLNISYLLHVIKAQQQECGLETFGNIVMLTLRSLENWYLVILLAVYLTTFVNFDPVEMFSLKIAQRGRKVLLIGPWLTGVIVAPSLFLYHHYTAYVFTRGGPPKGCVYLTYSSYRLTTDFGLIIPYLIKLVFLGVTVALYRRNKQIQLTTNMTSPTTGPTVPRDNISCYLVVNIINVITEAPNVVLEMFSSTIANAHLSSSTGSEYYRRFWDIVVLKCAFLCATEAQAVLVPPCLLLLGDIKERLKTWRPWYRPGPGIELALSANTQHKKEDE